MLKHDCHEYVVANTSNDTYLAATSFSLEHYCRLRVWPRQGDFLLRENDTLTSRGLRISVTHLDGSIALCVKSGAIDARRVNTSDRSRYIFFIVNLHNLDPTSVVVLCCAGSV